MSSACAQIGARGASQQNGGGGVNSTWSRVKITSEAAADRGPAVLLPHWGFVTSTQSEGKHVIIRCKFSHPSLKYKQKITKFILQQMHLWVGPLCSDEAQELDLCFFNEERTVVSVGCDQCDRTRATVCFFEHTHTHFSYFIKWVLQWPGRYVAATIFTSEHLRQWDTPNCCI